MEEAVSPPGDHRLQTGVLQSRWCGPGRLGEDPDDLQEADLYTEPHFRTHLSRYSQQHNTESFIFIVTREPTPTLISTFY